ncbi:hypothetical protein CGZ94_09115 [Enemella evansiae]|uniref:Uncharacterized protein n=1 Tax=Enemella evansiae TaxID=2016499 RepID=A0A255GK14_9ACTN|nr:hypothetical protein CGZ95_20805 [Enemella evansiae]OYO14713.1 hypothetical protein CGZ94_09115 [Enemella evansiae]
MALQPGEFGPMSGWSGWCQPGVAVGLAEAGVGLGAGPAGAAGALLGAGAGAGAVVAAGLGGAAGVGRGIPLRIRKEVAACWSSPR